MNFNCSAVIIVLMTQVGVCLSAIA